MATHRYAFGEALKGVGTTPPVWQPAALLDTNDLTGTEVLIYPDTGTLLTASGKFPVPQNYPGSPTSAKIIVRGKTTATSGNMLWTTDYRAVAVGETGDPASWQESLAGSATAVPGTTNLEFEVSFTLTHANLAAGDNVYVQVSRNGVSASDTVSATLQLIDAYFEYAD